MGGVGSVIRNRFGVNDIDGIEAALGAGNLWRVIVSDLDQLETGDAPTIATAPGWQGGSNGNLAGARNIHVAEFYVIAGVPRPAWIRVLRLDEGAAEGVLFDRVVRGRSVGQVDLWVAA